MDSMAGVGGVLHGQVFRFGFNLKTGWAAATAASNYPHKNPNLIYQPMF